jgi:hypothetical protein
MRKLFLTATVVVAVAATIATTAHLLYAQPVVQNTFSGNECWNSGQGPGGPSTGFICLAGVRAGVQLIPVTNANTLAPIVTSGCPACATTANLNYTTYLWHSTAPTTWAVTLPNPANDGQVVKLASDTTLTTLVTVTALTTPQNQTLSAAYTSQTITANTSGPAWQFSLSLLQWTRIQ